MTTEILRPELHATADHGVLDAPAGLLLDGDSWHLLHQYRPEADGPARWGHLRSVGGAFDWEECDDILAVEGDETTLRAGSVAAVDEDTLLIYFTSARPGGRAVHVARMHPDGLSAAAISDDPLTLNPHVERLGDAIRDTGGLSDFRSPSVVTERHDDAGRDGRPAGWLMTAVCGPAAKPAIAVARSRDGVAFDVAGTLRFEGDTGVAPGERAVSPRLARLRDEVDGRIRDILLITLEREEADVSGYLVGTLEGTVFTVSRPFQRLDWGHSLTRPRTAGTTPGSAAPDGDAASAVVVGLLPDAPGRLAADARGGGVHPTLAEEGWAQCVSLPRVMTLQGGSLFQTPPPGVIAAVGATDRARSWVGLCEVPADTGAEVLIELLDAAGRTAATVRHRGDSLELDRSPTPAHAGSEPARAPLAEGDTDALTVIVDGLAVEVFADGGSVAMTSRVLFDGGCGGLRVSARGGARVSNSFNRGPESVSAGRLPEWDDSEAMRG